MSYTLLCVNSSTARRKSEKNRNLNEANYAYN
jgi:hypothetical protein